jgi:phosphonate transport system substrate-binding protein
LRLWVRRNPLGALLILVLFLGLSISSSLAFLAVKWAVRAELSKDQLQAKRELGQKFRELERALLTKAATSQVFNSQLRAKAAGRPDLFPAEAEVCFLLYLSDSPDSMYAKFAPALASLEKSLSRPIDLIIYSMYEDAIAALVKPEVEVDYFARFGAVSYVEATRRNPGIKLIAVEEKKGRTTFKGYVVVRKGSPIKRISDLKGMLIALGDEHSTISSVGLKELLVKNEIHGHVQVKQFHSHVEVAEAVIRDPHVAGAIKSSTYERFKDHLERIGIIDDVPTKPWIAASGMERRTYEEIQSALLSLDDETRRELGVTGFVEGSDSLYDGVRESIRISEEFAVGACGPSE